MPDSLAQVAPPSATPHVHLACRLRRRPLARAASATAGEVELENVSKSAVAIRVESSPLQYLNLAVTGPDGKIVSIYYYGDLFSPLAEPYTLRLEPGEKYIAPVSLLGNVPEEKRVPGVYKVQAVYEWNASKSFSEVIELRIE